VPIVVQSDVQAVVSFVASEVNAFTDADLEFFEDAVRESAGVLNTLYLLGHERELTSKLRELDQMKNTFVSIVAHDLRSPMQVIAGFAETMRSHWDTLADTEKLEYLGIISRNITNLSQLVDDVLQVARIESGELEYRVEPFDLGRLVLRTVDELTADGARRCVVEVPAGLPMALGDERRQWQVLTNLIGNAFKFSDPPTPVEVRLAPRKSNGSAMLEVAVRDKGIGMGREDATRVFDKFSRLAPPAGTPAAKGSGLGLYICKMMVEAQGGSITVESKPSAGSTFRYTVPTG
jgi:signal transduction histidine kinase